MDTPQSAVTLTDTAAEQIRDLVADGFLEL